VLQVLTEAPRKQSDPSYIDHDRRAWTTLIADLWGRTRQTVTAVRPSHVPPSRVPRKQTLLVTGKSLEPAPGKAGRLRVLAVEEALAAAREGCVRDVGLLTAPAFGVGD